MKVMIVLTLTALFLGCETHKKENKDAWLLDFTSVYKDVEEEERMSRSLCFLAKHCKVEYLPVRKVYFAEQAECKSFYTVLLGANNQVSDACAVLREIVDFKSFFKGRSKADFYVFFFIPSNSIESLEGRYMEFSYEELCDILDCVFKEKYNDALGLIQKKRCREGVVPVRAKKIWDEW